MGCFLGRMPNGFSPPGIKAGHGLSDLGRVGSSTDDEEWRQSELEVAMKGGFRGRGRSRDSK